MRARKEGRGEGRGGEGACVQSAEKTMRQRREVGEEEGAPPECPGEQRQAVISVDAVAAHTQPQR